MIRVGSTVYMSKKKNKKWLRFRHRVVRNLAYAVLYPYSRLVYGIKIEKFRQQNGRQFLVLLNHQTPFDQFFVGMAFKGPVYYMATEDIFSLGIVSKLINYLVAPIPIKKQTTDIRAVLNCMRVAQEGGTICIAPEGNRTYSGRTEYMNPAIVMLVKKLSLPLALYRLEGGYGVQPRWSDAVRRGKMRGYVSRVIEPEEYKNMSDTELLALIKDGLYVNEAADTGEYRHKKAAEYLERCIYVCPHCGLSSFRSDKKLITCEHCGLQAEYLCNKQLKSKSASFSFRYVADWYDYQKDYINGLDVTAFTADPLYSENVSIYEVELYKRKHLLTKNAQISLYGDRICIDGTCYPFDSLSHITVLGKNKLNIYSDGKVYQLKGSKRFNALKYVHFFYRYNNIKGAKDDKFLGL